MIDEMNSKDATVLLKGKVVKCVQMRKRRNNGDGHTGWTFTPTIHFTDGTRINFFTVETGDEYGTDILYSDD